jgi:serine protease Do
MNGEVVGVNTAILSPSGGSVGIGFASPASVVKPIVDQLLQFGETRRGWLGVRIQQVDDQIAESLGLGRARGALVAGIDDKGPAKPAGLQSGDVIVRFDGQDVKNSTDLPRIVAATPVGKEVDVGVVRGGKERNLKVTLGRLEDGERIAAAATQGGGDVKPPRSVLQKALGMEFSSLNAETRKQFNLKDGVKGVVVTNIEASSPAAEKRVQAGDVIVEINQQPVNEPGDVIARMKQAKDQGRKSALFLIANAAGESRFVALPVE